MWWWGKWEGRLGLCPALKVLGWAPHSVSMDYFGPGSACLIEIEGCCPVMDQFVYRVGWVPSSREFSLPLSNLIVFSETERSHCLFPLNGSYLEYLFSLV